MFKAMKCLEIDKIIEQKNSDASIIFFGCEITKLCSHYFNKNEYNDAMYKENKHIVLIDKEKTLSCGTLFRWTNFCLTFPFSHIFYFVTKVNHSERKKNAWCIHIWQNSTWSIHSIIFVSFMFNIFVPLFSIFFFSNSEYNQNNLNFFFHLKYLFIFKTHTHARTQMSIQKEKFDFVFVFRKKSIDSKAYSPQKKTTNVLCFVNNNSFSQLIFSIQNSQQKCLFFLIFHIC